MHFFLFFLLSEFQMPKFTSSSQWMAGHISAKINELQRMLNLLGSDSVMSRAEIINMRGVINGNDRSLRSQHQSIDDIRLRPSLVMYEQILNLAIVELGRREDNKGHPVPESEAMRARRLRQPNLDTYASDGNRETPLECWTVPTSAPPVTAGSATDLRDVIEDRRNKREECVFRPIGEPSPERTEITDKWNEPKPGPSSATVRERHEKIRKIAHEQLERETTGSVKSYRSRSTRDGSPVSVSSHSSRVSYVSRAQSAFSEPIRGVAYPPMADWCPYPIQADDAGLIGRSEIYVRPLTGNQQCPACDGNHLMIRCETMKSPDMRERWFVALRSGVCLFCLKLGHSSLSCKLIGCCRRCETRHNSVLCPTLATNRLSFRPSASKTNQRK